MVSSFGVFFGMDTRNIIFRSLGEFWFDVVVLLVEDVGVVLVDDVKVLSPVPLSMESLRKFPTYRITDKRMMSATRLIAIFFATLLKDIRYYFSSTFYKSIENRAIRYYTVIIQFDKFVVYVVYLLLLIYDHLPLS